MDSESIHILPNKQQTSQAAAKLGAQYIRQALDTKKEACIVLATGVSQFDVLNTLLQEKDIDWHRVTGFHLDEYADLPITHPASFSKYLWERFVRQLPVPMKAFHFIQSAAGIDHEIARLNNLILEHNIDVAFIGIGENGHIAFNDPPANFDTTDPYIFVELDAACRQQQLGEGWFNSLEEVPTHAISMSIQHILKSNHIICTVPGTRKARAVRDSLSGDITPLVPASILRNHTTCHLFLDEGSASMLR